jgi:gluconolactonase
MDAPNDLVIGPDARLWVTDTRAEIDFFHPDATKPGWVWAVDTSTGAKELMLDSGPVFIHGLGFQPGCGRTDGNHDIRGTTVELSNEASRETRQRLR